MAKRKRKRNPDEAPAAPPRVAPPAAPPGQGLGPDLLRTRLRQKDRVMELVGEELEKRNFATQKEVDAFLKKNFVGRNMEDILADFGGSGTPRETALDILDAIPFNVPPAIARKEIARAIKADPDCLEAYLALANLERTAAQAIKPLKKAIAIGRRIFADEIASTSEEYGLWSYHPARPFLDALFNLARLREAQRRFDQAEAAYREILELNHGDNQGARYELVTLLQVRSRDEEALALIGEYDDDPGCHWLFARALSLFRVAVAETDYDLAPRSKKEASDIAALTRRIEDLPSEFDEANRALDRGLESYPFVFDFIDSNPKKLDALDEPESYRFGSPEEALIYAKGQGYLWIDCPITLTWLELASERVNGSRKGRAARRKHSEELKRYADLLGWRAG